MDTLGGYSIGQNVKTSVDGLPGRIVGIVPETTRIEDGLGRVFEATPAFLSVNVYLPPNHPRFWYTDREENFWLLPDEVSLP